MTRNKIIIKIIFVFIAITLAIIGIFVSNKTVIKITENSLYDDVAKIPMNKVGLLLGTGKYLSDGRLNLYYQYRLEATKELYDNGKIEFVLISGDNSRKTYNEPQMFKEDLVKLGIPKEKIYLDYAGFRTLDSVIRSNKIFGQNKITIISQRFHNERAIYISKHKDIDAIGYNAKDVNKLYGFKTRIREKLARVKMMMDLYVTNKQPKYLGEKIEIK